MIGISLSLGLRPTTTGSASTLEQLVAAMEPQSWFPTSDPTAMFLTDPGSVNVASNDDTIGLQLDKRLMAGASASAYIAAQAELFSGWDIVESPWVDNGDGTWTIDGSQGEDTDLIVNSLIATDACGSFNFAISEASSSLLFYLQRNIPLVLGNGDYSYVGLTNPPAFRIRAGAGVSATVRLISVKSVPGNHQSQATASYRPKYKPATISRKYDGTDDYLAGNAKCGASGNSLAVKIIAPATLASAQVIAGMQADTSTRFYLAVDASGHLCAGVGTDGITTIVGTTDIRGLTGSAMLIEDGVNVYLYWNGNLEYSGARNGTPSTTPVIYEGALNNNGTAASFFSGEVIDRIFHNAAFTTDERTELLSLWS